MKQKKIIFIFFIIILLLFTLNFKQVREVKEQKERPDPKNTFQPQTQIPCLNNGLPFTPDRKGTPYASEQILVKFKPSISDEMVKATITSYRLKRIKRIPRLNIYQLQVPEDLTVEEMVSYLNKNPDVEYAEPNYKAYLAVTPNDTLFKYQYALQNSGQAIGIPGSPQGKPSADIKATAGWEETKGDEDTVIAILDTGVDMKHPDLKDNILFSGYDFANDDYDPTDDHYHGTHVAGIAAAVTNNSEGIAGVAWNCKILPVKVIFTPAEGEPYALYSWVIEGIRYAVDNEAQVINLSLGGDMYSNALEDAVRYAVENEVTVVAAAGNEAGSVLYPAAFDEYCLAVAATDYNDYRADWSNFGPEVDVAAPGVRVLSCVPTWYFGEQYLPYGFGFGTSMSTPHVSGLAALIKSIKPWMTPHQIMKAVRYTADDINKTENPGKDEYVGYGRVNMEKVLVPIIISQWPLKFNLQKWFNPLWEYRAGN